MGEYATYDGQQVKIGTCENMYYLRADQRHKVQKLAGSLDPADDSVLPEIRFRFPWPDEDGNAPGAFDKYERSLGMNMNFSKPLGCEHGRVQFIANVGMNLSIPCPIGPNARKDIEVHKNGWSGDFLLVQTAYREGEWRVVCQCGACHYAFNMPLWAAEELAVAIRCEGDRREKDSAGGGIFYQTVADRVLAGYAGALAKQAEVLK